MASGARAADVSVRAAVRFLADGHPGAGGVELGAPLEHHQSTIEPPRTIAAASLEGTTLRARRVEGEPEVGFAAFLDGTQRSHVVAYPGGVPIVHGTVAAVVRERRNRRMTTWRHRVEPRLYVPAAWLPADLVARLAEQFGDAIVDTTAPDGGREAPGAHPFALLERAVHLVQEDRERAEQSLARQWCAHEARALFIDGGISGSEAVAQAPCAVGVIKSHRTLYAEGEALRVVLALPCGWRTTVFRVTSARRSAVASWYLRLREPAGRDPLWGLVRVEVAAPEPGAPPAEVTRRADQVSRWILAEAAPLSLPDARWDKMVYGIRDCEEFLKAVG